MNIHFPNRSKFDKRGTLEVVFDTTAILKLIPKPFTIPAQFRLNWQRARLLMKPHGNFQVI